MITHSLTSDVKHSFQQHKIIALVKKGRQEGHKAAGDALQTKEL